MGDRYILVGQTPVPCADLFEWAHSFELADRRVAFSNVMGICNVSTVFLGIDHSFGGPTPMLFETMAFWPGEYGDEMMRCATWSEAEAQHKAMVRDVARPAAVARYCIRTLQTWWQNARYDWRLSWRELRGIEPTELEEIARTLFPREQY